MNDLENLWVEPSLPSTLAFDAVLALAIALFVLAVAHVHRNEPGRRRAVGLAIAGALAWMGVTAAFVKSGAMASGGPAVIAFFASINLGGIALAFSPLGTRLARGLPLAALAGFHVFRLPLELVLHSWAEQGTIPVQMSYSGHNFDILTGVAALLVIGVAVARRGEVPRALLLGFNALGSGLLLAVIVIVALSSPIPIKAYEGPPLLLALHLPFAWIGTVLVMSAVAGHLILWRALLGAREE